MLLSRLCPSSREVSSAKFDETVEVHFPPWHRHPSGRTSGSRGMVSLPNGSVREVRVAVFFAEGCCQAAKEAGAKSSVPTTCSCGNQAEQHRL